MAYTQLLTTLSFIDLKQVEAKLHHMLIKIIQVRKMHVHEIQGRHSLTKTKSGTLHNIAKGLVPQVIINCCYLGLFAAKHSAIRRYWPLILPLFAAIGRKLFRYLLLT